MNAKTRHPAPPLQPLQPVVKDVAGVQRFRENAIVGALLARSGLTQDQLEALDPAFAPEDRAQVAQLLGTPVSDHRFDAIRSKLPAPVVLKKKGYQPHPMQPVVQDPEGVLRFHWNRIVRRLLDRDRDRGRVYPDFPARSDGGLNWIAEQEFSREDMEQFMQLIGYSITGYHELSFVSDESAAEASALAHTLAPGAGGCRDKGCPIHGGPPPRHATRNSAKTPTRRARERR